MAKTARDLRRDPGRMLKLLPQMSPADEQAVQRAYVRVVIRAMSTEAFRQGGRGTAHDLRLEALPWGVSLESIEAERHADLLAFPNVRARYLLYT